MAKSCVASRGWYLMRPLAFLAGIFAYGAVALARPSLPEPRYVQTGVETVYIWKKDNGEQKQENFSFPPGTDKPYRFQIILPGEEKRFDITQLLDRWDEVRGEKAEQLTHLLESSEDCDHYKGTLASGSQFKCEYQSRHCTKYGEEEDCSPDYDQDFDGHIKRSGEICETKEICVAWEKATPTRFKESYLDISRIQKSDGLFDKDNLIFYNRKGKKYEVDFESEDYAIHAVELLTELQDISIAMEN